MQIAEVQEFTQNVEGFLSQNSSSLFEGEVLFHLARRASGPIVEIGSWKGKSTIWIGKGSEMGSGQQVIAIDPHTGSEEHTKGGKSVWTFDAFQKNIERAQLTKLVHPLRMTSEEGAPQVKESVGFVFIDGAHDYASVKRDFETWLPKVQEGGVVAFHDSFGPTWPDVSRYVGRLMRRSSKIKKVRYITSITYMTLTDKNTFSERLENWGVWLLRAIHLYSLYFPQPFKSILKRLIWRPFRTKWLAELRGSSTL